jgi:uncharacterized protein (AIM24 family)
LGLHFASQHWKTALNDGVKVRTEGSGLLCFFGHGQVRSLELDGTAPLVIDERALVAYESSLAVRNRAGSAKEVLVGGEGILLSVEGSGKIWLQTREKMAGGGGGGLIEGIFGLFK